MTTQYALPSLLVQRRGYQRSTPSLIHTSCAAALRPMSGKPRSVLWPIESVELDQQPNLSESMRQLDVTPTDVRNNAPTAFSRMRRYARAGLLLAALAVALPLHAAIPTTERTALVNLYTSAQGSQWSNHSGWNGAVGTECYWAGVTCDAAQSTVISLNLANNNLHGTLSAVTALPDLTLLDVSQNVLTGSIPSLTGLSTLQVLNVQANQLSGPLPAFTGLIALREVRAYSNQLTGSIPSLTDPTGLTYVNAQSNQLSGPIPPLVQLTSLQTFNVSSNQLSGSLPSIAGLTNLQQFDVEFNGLTGSVPALSSLTSLQGFYIGHNNLSGALPSPPASVGAATLCPNVLLSEVDDTGWDLITGTTPWYQNCASASKLAILSVNNGVSPTVGAKFSVVIVAQNTNGQATTLTSTTGVQLSLVQGSGQLYSQSNLSCTIPVGGSTCTVDDTSYSIVDSGVQIEAAGSPYYYSPQLDSVPSAPFSVVAGAYTIGGTVSGLAGSGLVLSLYPGSQRMTISANGPFAFPIPVGNGAYYSATVVSSPTSPLQQCSPQGSGNVNGANVTSIQVICITQRTVTVSGGGVNGSVSPSTQTVASGSTATFYISANTGYYPQVSANGCTVTSQNSNYWTTNALSSDCQITVTFLPVQFIPLTPARLLDTRKGATTIDGQFAGIGAMKAGVPLAFSMLGRGGVPSTGVGAVVLNVTATNTTAPGYLTAWPSCAARPLASNLNFVGQQTVANLVIVKVGCDDKADLFSSTGPTDAVADVVGYFLAGPGINPLVPARLLDTRAGAATIDGVDAGIGAVAGGTQIDLTVAGRAGIPASGAGTVAINVTATNPSAASYVTVWPTDTARPLASNLNFVAGQTVPNLVIGKLSASGQISLFNSAGVTDLIGDVVAWFPTNSNLISITPARLVDTRVGATTVDGQNAGTGPIASASTLQFGILGRGGVPSYGVSAVVLNVTVTNPSQAGYLTVWSSGDARPQASNLNFVPGATVPNLVITRATNYYYGGVSVYNSAGTSDIVVDVVGWFVGP